MIRRFIFISIAFVYSVISSAQTDYTMLPMKHIPQSSRVNPQFFPDYRSYAGIPVLSSIYFNAYSSSLSFSDLVNRNKSIDFSSAMNRLNDRNYFSTDMAIDWFSGGYKKGNHYFNFNVTEVLNVYISYPKELLELMWYGNGSFLGQNVYLDGLAADFTHYREFSLGYSTQYDKNWTFGIKVKYLNGKSIVQTEKNALFFYTDEDSYNTYINGSYSTYTAGLFNDDGSSSQYKLFGNKNHGVALDLGISYKLNKWKFDASILDYGFINWRDNANVRYNDSILVKYEGIKIGNVFNVENEVDSGIQSYTDTINSTLEFDVLPRSFSSELVTSFVLGLEYELNKNIDLSAYYVHSKYREEFRPMVLVNGNYKLKNWLVFSLNYNLNGVNYTNVGLGLTFKVKFAQLYFVTNNIASHFKPENSRNVNYRAGLNLIFNGREKKSLPVE